MQKSCAPHRQRIRFRKKAPKKKRSNLHKELLNDDYYCVVNTSNAANQAIWAGVPAITLDRHITNRYKKQPILTHGEATRFRLQARPVYKRRTYEWYS